MHFLSVLLVHVSFLKFEIRKEKNLILDGFQHNLDIN